MRYLAIVPVTRKPQQAIPIFPVQELAGRCNRANIFVARGDLLSIEGLESHTVKILRCAALVESAKPGEKTVFVQITTGNYGLTLGRMAKDAEKEGKQIQVVNVVDRNLSTAIKQKLRECSIVVEVDLKGKRITDDELRQIAIHEAGCTLDQVKLVHTYPVGGGYEKIVDSIVLASIRPDYIFCPVGSGELAVALSEAAKRAWPAQTPLIVAATIPENACPPWIGLSFLRRLRQHVADKLVDPVGIYKEHLRSLDRESRVLFANIAEESVVVRVHRELTMLGIPNEPSAAVAFAVAMDFGRYSENGLKPSDTVVIVNTGKGIYDEKLVENYGWRRLKQVAVKASYVIAGAICMLGILIGSLALELKFKKQNRDVLEAQALAFAENEVKDNRPDGYLNKNESTVICKSFPEEQCDGNGRKTLIYGFNEYTDCELTYYLNWSRFAHAMGGVEVQIRAQIEEEWRSGTYPCLVESRGSLWHTFSNGYLK